MKQLKEPVRDPEGEEIKHLHRLQALPGRKVLEIGCGNGRLVQRYADIATRVVGIDPDRKSLAETIVRRRVVPQTPVFFVQAEAQVLPFRNGAFECAIFGWSL